MWEALVVEPIFNLLVLIGALIPGHNFGLALLIFTVLVRLAFWPLVRKQVRHSLALRQLQPEIKKIKQRFKGRRQQEQVATLALYKQRGFNPFAPIGYMLIQIPVFIGLYQVVNRLANPANGSALEKLQPQALGGHLYDFVANLDWLQRLQSGAAEFDTSFLGLVDLSRAALGPEGLFVGALVIVLLSAAAQYYSTKQLLSWQAPVMASGQKPLRLRQLLKQQSQGKDVDQADINAAVNRGSVYLFPGLVLLVSLGLVAALPFYWLANNLVAYGQQAQVYRQLDRESPVETRGGRKVVSAKVIDSSAPADETEADKPLNAKQKRAARTKANKTKKG